MKERIKEIVEEANDWIGVNVTPTVILSVVALIISILSAVFSIGNLIQYLLSHY